MNVDATSVAVSLATGGDANVPKKDCYPANPVSLDGVEDCTGLLFLSEATILANLSFRYSWDLIYTRVGSILLAINPFKRLQIYDAHMMERYRGNADAETAHAPHPFAIADAAFSDMSSRKVCVVPCVVIVLGITLCLCR